MKKTIVIILAWVMLLSLTACNESEKAETTTPLTETTVPPIETDPVFETTSFTETNPPKKSTSFELTLDEILPVLEKANVLGDFVTYETSEYTVHRTGYGTDGALLFSSPGSEKIEAAFFLAYSRASRQADDTEAAIYAQDLLCEFCEVNGIEYKALEIEREPYLVFEVYALDSTLDNLPLSIRQLRSENEFFSNEERANTFRNFMYSCKYQELRDYVEEFIAEGQCPDNDVSYNLVAKLDELIPVMENCRVEADNVEKTAKIFYKDVTDITRKINVLPVIEVHEYGASLDVTVGFIRNDWLFFDMVYFASAMTETEKFSLGSTTTAVLSGGSVYEGDSIGGSAQNALMAICNNDDPVIRFENSDAKEHMDHKLTDKEIEALKQLQYIRDLHDEIWDSLSKWEDA